MTGPLRDPDNSRTEVRGPGGSSTGWNPFASLTSHRDLFMNFLQRELRLRYRQSILGWGWSLANPLLLTAVYTVVFTKFLVVTPEPGSPSGMKSFTFFLLCGLLPWNFFTGSLNVGMGSLLGAVPLMQKVRFPRDLTVTGPIAALAVSFAVEMGVLVVAQLAFGYLTIKFLPVILLISVFFLLFTTGVALVLAAMNLRYRDVQHLVNIALLVLFYLTPILYSPLLIPERLTLLGVDLPARTILLNLPLSRFVQLYRNCLYDVRLPPLDTLLYVGVMSIAVFTFGARYFNRRTAQFTQ